MSDQLSETPKQTSSESVEPQPTNAQRFEKLRLARDKRKAQEAMLAGLQNKVSLLQKEEQRVLHKIMCIGSLKERINRVASINHAYQRQMMEQEEQRHRELMEKREKNWRQRQEHNFARGSRDRESYDGFRQLRQNVRQERENLRLQKELEARQKTQSIQKLGYNNRMNHEIVLQVREWEAEAAVGRRLERARWAEEARLAKLETVNRELRKRRSEEMHALTTEQLVQEKLFEELKDSILRH
jgi:hypothetical protein